MVTKTSSYSLVYPLIILAGGSSSRMGQAKGLLPYKGKPWLEHQLATFSEYGGEEAIVVLGYSYQTYLIDLPWLTAAQNAPHSHLGLKIRTVINMSPELGSFSSLQTGARALLSSDATAAFILPIDVPAASLGVWQKLSIVMTEKLSACVPQYEGSGGHPVLLSRAFLKKLSELSPTHASARLDQQLHALGQNELLRVTVDDSCVRLNLNTPEDWKKFRV